MYSTVVVAVTLLDVFDDVAVAVQMSRSHNLVTLLVFLPQPFRRLLKVSALLFCDFRVPHTLFSLKVIILTQGTIRGRWAGSGTVLGYYYRVDIVW